MTSPPCPRIFPTVVTPTLGCGKPFPSSPTVKPGADCTETPERVPFAALVTPLPFSKLSALHDPPRQTSAEFGNGGSTTPLPAPPEPPPEPPPKEPPPPPPPSSKREFLKLPIMSTLDITSPNGSIHVFGFSAPNPYKFTPPRAQWDLASHIFPASGGNTGTGCSEAPSPCRTAAPAFE